MLLGSSVSTGQPTKVLIPHARGPTPCQALQNFHSDIAKHNIHVGSPLSCPEEAALIQNFPQRVQGLTL